MHMLNGHLEGRKLVLDDPLPDALPQNVRVRVTIEVEGGEIASKPRCLEEIAAMAIDTDLPPDFSTQFAHYIKGHPRK
jgi:hypothetical protein